MTVFARVAAARSFSAAARDLGISQATVSKHVQTLEQWLGTRLLHRTTRRVGLTDAGSSFVTQCARILEAMETARQTGRTAARLRGDLRITAPVVLGCTRLGTLLNAFMVENPDISFNVTISERRVDVVEEGYDVALRTWMQAADDPSLTVYALAVLPLAVCAAPAFLAAHGTPQLPADLAGLVCLTNSRLAGDIWRFTGREGETGVAVGGRLKADSDMLRRQMALDGGGILLCPAFIVEDDIAAGRLVRLLPDHTPPTIRLDAVCPAERAETAKVRRFVAFLEQRLAGLPAFAPPPASVGADG